ncbi:hypothetical protein LT493_25065 [Streptomyces tricolor]|nr:hypothetical protein [Streptomyces tricolor]
MISVFLAFVLSGDRVIAMFGIALAAAVALDAFVLQYAARARPDASARRRQLGGCPAGWSAVCRVSASNRPECRASHERLGRVPVDELRKEERHDVRDIAR